MIVDLCGADLCTDDAVCSYLLRRVRVCLCESHLRELSRKSNLSLKEIAAQLPFFTWIGTPLDQERA